MAIGGILALVSLASMCLRRPHAPTQQAKPFDHPEWLFEVKFDGFRALPASTVSVS
jgi:ATP-dependent DNA ligase